jgi:hypothetical protein
VPPARLLGVSMFAALLVAAIVTGAASIAVAQTGDAGITAATGETGAPPGGADITDEPAGAEPADQIVLSGDVLVRRGSEVGEVVILHGRAEIAGVARGDVVVLDGRIDVTGQVSGSVVSIDGPVTLGPNAHVLGDVIARERVKVADGAIVDGRIRGGTSFLFRTPIDVFGPFATWFAVMVSTLALGCLLLALAPRASEAVALAARTSPVVSGALGLALAVGIPVVAALLVVSIVAWPLGLATLLGVWLLATLGFAWTVFAVGRLLWREPRSRWLALLFGWLVAAAVAAIPIVGGIAWGLGAAYGAGAATIALWRARHPSGMPPAPRGRHRAGAKAPTHEPRPEPPPLVTERAMGREGTGI